MKNDVGIIEFIPLLIMLGISVFFIVEIGIPLSNSFDHLLDHQNFHSIDRADNISIMSLNVETQTNGYFYGGFILGEGQINSQDVYIYYTKTANGGYVRNHINADQTTIYEDENISPFLICHYVETDKYHEQFINSYDLHVPNGTVVKQYTTE